MLEKPSITAFNEGFPTEYFLNAEHILSSVILLVRLLAALEAMPLPALPVTVLLLNLGVLDAVRVTPALLGARVLVHDPPRDRRHARDARLGEQSLVLLELSVPLVRSNIGLGSGQISDKKTVPFIHVI